MQTEFAKEKSIYSHALHIFMNLDNTEPERIEAYEIMQGVEELLKAQDDEICIITTTIKTNPLKDKTAPPMQFYTPKDRIPHDELIDACHTCNHAVINCTCEAGS